ncbi:MAG: hypothetical protein AB8I08_40485, partial [Sandaracinaceae bacterium]
DDALPDDALPDDALPDDALPDDALPSDALPDDALPSDATPGDETPAGEARPETTVEPGPAVDVPSERRIRPSAAGTLLRDTHDWKGLARRAAAGAGLSMVYGVALGAREGGLDLVLHAVGVPSALLAVTLLGLPALYIVLALFNAPLSLRRAGSAAARGIASAGIVLAGLSPLAALFVVTSSSSEGAAIAGGLGLCVGGALGLRHLASTLSEALRDADSATRTVAGFAQLGFVFFAALLAWRVWGALLPLLGGA